jgi:hypothetical protein
MLGYNLTPKRLNRLYTRQGKRIWPALRHSDISKYTHIWPTSMGTIFALIPLAIEQQGLSQSLRKRLLVISPPVALNQSTTEKKRLLKCFWYFMPTTEANLVGWRGEERIHNHSWLRNFHFWGYVVRLQSRWVHSQSQQIFARRWNCYWLFNINLQVFPEGLNLQACIRQSHIWCPCARTARSKLSPSIYDHSPVTLSLVAIRKLFV